MYARGDEGRHGQITTGSKCFLRPPAALVSEQADTATQHKPDAKNRHVVICTLTERTLPPRATWHPQNNAVGDGKELNTSPTSLYDKYYYKIGMFFLPEYRYLSLCSERYVTLTDVMEHSYIQDHIVRA